MSIFDLFTRRRTTGSPALRRSVQQYQSASSPAGLHALYRQLLDSTLVIMLNQQAGGVKNGALVTPRTGARLEFVTSINRESNTRVAPVFTDIESFTACFAMNAGSKRDTIIPHVLMRARDLLPILATSGMGMELRTDQTTMHIDGEVVGILSQGRIPQGRQR